MSFKVGDRVRDKADAKFVGVVCETHAQDQRKRCVVKMEKRYRGEITEVRMRSVNEDGLERVR